MKFTISKEDFIEGLQQVQHVVSNRTTLPILSNVLLEADGDSLRLTTTDLDVGVTGSVKAKVGKPGSTTLPARRLAGIVRELPADEVSIEVTSKDVASIKSGPSFFKILGLAKDEFPPLATFEDANEYKIEQKVLKEALKMTSYAISNDETRYVLNGILCSFKEGLLTLVATDGRRLAMVQNDVEFPKSLETEVIVPTKAVNELQRLLADDGEVKISISDSQIAFELNDNLLVSKLIEGNYPNYNQVIPEETKERISLERESFLSTVNRVSLLANEKSNSVKCVFGKDQIDVTANSQDVGEANESIAVSYKGPEFSIAFNPEFLMAPLRNIDTDEIFLELIDEMSPGVIKTTGSFLYVLMPMRVSQ
ncbi:MAG: DNA polymerase III subunit beta [Akkermansiaceae bacterium]|jgi:DNA polymerase III subunit beta|nr:DNA polymerase III subunit beta [Akkermansiaceae bacterium]MDG1852828.1 DNA polymerase III subunit beta [Verrucomicrobiales bacterium]